MKIKAASEKVASAIEHLEAEAKAAEGLRRDLSDAISRAERAEKALKQIDAIVNSGAGASKRLLGGAQDVVEPRKQARKDDDGASADKTAIEMDHAVIKTDDN